MDTANLKYFKYEIALGSPLPVPQPKVDWYPNNQNSVQQFLHTLCKAHVGALVKRAGKWAPGEEQYQHIKLATRQDITEIFDFAEQLGIIQPDAATGDAVPYKLSQAYWEKFDKFAT